MPDIPLTDALAALIRDLRRATSGSPEDGVEVELSLVARADRHGVTWQLATTEDVGAVRVRLTVHPWRWPPPDIPVPDLPPAVRNPPPAVSYAPKPGYDETSVGLDPNRLGSAHLPPIVRPKPGVDIERDDD
ncbi:hypothetical protein [Micromonospora endophytica]|uniref:hypothetical protein n=1 Tax=Micromonospora endophytica TaxID=515350 RepID=UPI0011B7F4AB|nr:hypothetical protein [Micromonospora endophytica]BCJ61450.1 hypothetical protein Jiend_48720 [Micromonospora endophytica]